MFTRYVYQTCYVAKTKSQTPLHGHRLRTPATNTTNEHHQRTSSQQVVHRGPIKNKTPNSCENCENRLLFGEVMDKSLVSCFFIGPRCRCCTTCDKLHYTDTGSEHRLRTPPTDKKLPHPNILTCRDVGLWHCDVVNLL